MPRSSISLSMSSYRSLVCYLGLLLLCKVLLFGNKQNTLFTYLYRIGSVVSPFRKFPAAHWPCCLVSFHPVLSVSVNIFIFLGSGLLYAFPSLCFFLELSCHVVVS